MLRVPMDVIHTITLSTGLLIAIVVLVGLAALAGLGRLLAPRARPSHRPRGRRGAGTSPPPTTESEA